MLLPVQSCTKCEITYPKIPHYEFKSGPKRRFKYMRVINRSVTALLLTVSTMALAGCLGTNYPPVAPALINESASGTGFVATRNLGFTDMTTTSNGANMTGATIGSGVDNAVFTAFTNGTSGNFGFIVDLPADSIPSDTAGSAAIVNLNGGGFANVAGVFPTGSLQGTVTTYDSSDITSVGTLNTATPTVTGSIQVDKFGTSQALQDSEYGFWAENGSTAGLNATTANTVGAFAIGVPTTIMPSSGTANYVGGAAGVATSATGGGEFAGTTNMTAVFGVGGGTISGAITGIKFLPAGDANTAPNIGTMNNITLSGGTIAGNTFAGAAAVGAAGTSGNGTNFDISAANSGSFGGQFNGLSAAEIAGTFKLSSGNGAATTNVVGSFGAKN
jgi:hypothetical protein